MRPTGRRDDFPAGENTCAQTERGATAVGRITAGHQSAGRICRNVRK